MALLRATIKVGNLYYQGEDIDREVPATLGASLTGGWHNHNHTGGMMQALKFGDDNPHVLIGDVGIRGAMERILRYIKAGHIEPGEIVIETEWSQ